MTLGETSTSPLHNQLPPADDEALQKGRQWVEGLREISELEGILLGDPEDELQSVYFRPEGCDVLVLVPGRFPFWRVEEHIQKKDVGAEEGPADGDQEETLISPPYQTAKPMQIASYRFRKDNRGETWVHFRSPATEGSFEKAHVRLSRLEENEHSIAISSPAE